MVRFEYLPGILRRIPDGLAVQAPYCLVLRRNMGKRIFSAIYGSGSKEREGMAASFKWKPSYSVGHPVLDQQHQGFFILCQQAVNSLELADSAEGIEQFHGLLHALAEYARQHFRTEERLLRAVSFPGLDAHIAEHHRYEEHLTDLLMSAVVGEPDPRGLLEFAAGWCRTHIMTTDADYREYVQGLVQHG